MISAYFQSEKLELVMLLLQVMTIKTDGKAKYYFNCRMKVDTSVRIFVPHAHRQIFYGKPYLLGGLFAHVDL